MVGSFVGMYSPPSKYPHDTDAIYLSYVWLSPSENAADSIFAVYDECGGTTVTRHDMENAIHSVIIFFLRGDSV